MKLLMLEAAWLGELGVTDKWDKLTRGEKQIWKARAKTAADRVQNQFKIQHNAGRLKDVTVAYKRHKATEVKPLSWSTFVKYQQEVVIRQMAREQMDRAQRGIGQ